MILITYAFIINEYGKMKNIVTERVLWVKIFKNIQSMGKKLNA